MTKKKDYPLGRVATIEEMLALADVFAKEDTEDGLDVRHIDKSEMKKLLKRQAIRAKYARWQKQNEKLSERRQISDDRLLKIQNDCSHPEEDGYPPRDGDDGQYTCKDCGRERRVPHRDAEW